jgi:phosphate transport system permease protein
LPYRITTRGFALLMAGISLLFFWCTIHQAWPALHKYTYHMFTGSAWNISNNQFGILPLILGTLITTAVALVIAVPVGVMCAMSILYVVPRRIRTLATSLVELLAAIPSVVYGVWGIVVLIPWFSNTVEPFLSGLGGPPWLFARGVVDGEGLLLAGSVLGIMILPTVVAISRDAIAVVPHELIEGGLSLGATRSQTLRTVVVPAAKSGIFGAVSLGAARALGETIAVAMVIGSNPNLPHSLLSTGASLASEYATQYPEAYGIQVAALGVCALTLMVITTAVNALARRFTRNSGFTQI